MNEKNNKKIESYKKMILRQSERIKSLNLQVDKLKLELEKKDEIINSVADLREELSQNVSDIKSYKEQYRELVEELRKMKSIVNQEVYNGRWNIVKFFIK